MGRPAAFFDLDKTLLIINSGSAWFRRERAEGRITALQAVEAVVWLGLYHVGMMKPEIAFGRAIKTCEGLAESDMVERCERFFREVVLPRFAPGGLAVLERHRAAGEPVVLLSSTSPYLARPVAEHLHLDGWLCTHFEVRDGAFTGELILPLCYGEGKVEHAERWAAENDVDLDASAFYTDSITDLPMLERVGRPVVVQPDGRLRRLARKRGWPIEDWSAAAASEGPDPAAGEP